MLDTPGKLRISHRSVGYVGVPAGTAIANAMMESIGLRQLIDDACVFDRVQRDLSPGMAAKAMIATTFNIRNKDPLYLVNKAYRAAPVARMFGKNHLTSDSLNEDALGRALDTIAKTDLEKLFHDASERCIRRYGFESNVLHMDSTNWKFCGIHRDAPEGIATPEYTGHPKDRMRDLLHYSLQVLTDSNRIIRGLRPYSGNVSDSRMDSDMLDFIRDQFPEDSRRTMTVVADSKLMNARNLEKMLGMDIGFVSRCPASFGKKVQARVKELIRSDELFTGDGIKVADVDLDAAFGRRTHRLRFVAVRRERRVQERLAMMRAEVEAIRARFAKLEEGYSTSSHGVTQSFLSVKYTQREYISVSWEAVDCSAERGSPSFRLKVTADLNRKAVRIAEDECTFVLVTNLPRAEKDADNARMGVTADGVRRLYDEEYVVERSFRFMKSGLGIDTVYLQTPERENAMMMLMGIATLVTNIADAVFAREGMTLDGRTMTMHGLAYELQGTIVTLSDDDVLSIMQPSDSESDLFEITDVLGLNPQLLLGFAN